MPHGATARRLDWRFLPPRTRALVEQQLGSPVVTATSQDGGFTPGFASILDCVDGSRHFVKAAAAQAQPQFAQSYRDEIAVLRALTDQAPAPALLWASDDDWVVLETQFVDGRSPARPWQPDELRRSLEMLEQIPALPLPEPGGAPLVDATEELGGWAALWDTVAAQRPDLPHLEDAAALAARYAEAVSGDALVHGDVRDDNLLLTPDHVRLCDWNWPFRGADWLDSLSLLLGARLDGLDVDPSLRESAPLRAADPEQVDIALALFAGYYLKGAADPVPPTSPYLRLHQAGFAHAAWSWLAERRGW